MTVALTQSETDTLFVIEKHRVDEPRWRLPDTDGGIVVPLIADCDDPLHPDISRGPIVRAMNNPSRSTAQDLMKAWIDTRESRRQAPNPLPSSATTTRPARTT